MKDFIYKIWYLVALKSLSPSNILVDEERSLGVNKSCYSYYTGWPKSRLTVVPLFVLNRRIRAKFAELFVQQHGAHTLCPLPVREYINQSFTQRWIDRRRSIKWQPRSPDLTLLDFFLEAVVKNVYERNLHTVDELKLCISEEFIEIDTNQDFVLCCVLVF